MDHLSTRYQVTKKTMPSSRSRSLTRSKGVTVVEFVLGALVLAMSLLMLFEMGTTHFIPPVWLSMR